MATVNGVPLRFNLTIGSIDQILDTCGVDLLQVEPPAIYVMEIDDRAALAVVEFCNQDVVGTMGKDVFRSHLTDEVWGEVKRALVLAIENFTRKASGEHKVQLIRKIVSYLKERPNLLLKESFPGEEKSGEQQEPLDSTPEGSPSVNS
jgi:hypothetical protein